MNPDQHFNFRFVENKDVEALHDLFNIPQVNQYLADGVAPARSLSEQWVADAAKHAERSGGGLWILELVEDYSLVGLVRLSEDGGRLELTYVVHPSFWKRGLATKIAKTALFYSSKAKLSRHVWAGADRANIGSVKVMQKLGMGFDRDVEYPLGPGVEYSLNLDDISFSPHFGH